MADTDEVNVDRKRLLNAVGTLSRALASRRAFQQYDGDREIDETLGYRKRITISDYLGRYKRMGLAGSIVDKPAKTTWRSDPEILEAGSDEVGKDEETEFVEAVREHARATRLWTRAEQADRLAGIKNYAVMLIGSTVSDRLSEPLEDDPIAGPEDVGFYSVFRQDNADIRSVEADTSSPRFGLPTTYDITLFAERSGMPTPDGVDSTQEVHWSRVIHVAEDTLVDDLFGRPRLERVFNDLDDVLKTSGSAAEVFWQQVAGILVAKHAENADLDDDDLEDFEDDLLDALHKITRVLQLQNTDLEYLKPENLLDPEGPFGVSKQLISAGTTIPQRILFGSERGELASTQDEANWFGSMEERRLQHAEPVIIRPTIDRLISVGAVPEPSSGGYRIEWEPLFQLSELQQAEVQESRAKTVKALAEAFLTGGELAMEMAAHLVPGLAEVLEDERAALNAFRDEEDEAAAREVERLLAEVADRYTDGNGRRRRATRPGDRA